MKKSLLIPLSVLFLFFLSAYVGAYTHVLEYRIRLARESIRATAPPFPPEVMNVLAGEYKGLLSDYLLLEAAAFIGANTKPTQEDWEAVALLFKQTMALDPHFKQSYRLFQAVLPWEAEKYDLTIELLEKSKNNRPWDWVPGFFIGFDYFYFLEDNVKASEYLMEASKVPEAPMALATLAARLALKGGQTLTAIAFLRAMYEKEDDEGVKETLRVRIEALIGVWTLEQGISQFTSRFGHPPETLEELLSSGVLKEIPTNPYGNPYTYEDGQIGY